MHVRRDRLLTRTLGTLVGIGFCLLGAYALVGRSHLDVALSDRAFWYGMTLIVVGLLAMLSSWVVKDLDNLWCRPPRRW